MSTINAKVTVQSSTLFPPTINVQKTLTQNVNGNYSSFQRNELNPATTETIVETTEMTGNSGVMYLYVEASSTNSSHGVDIKINNKTTDGEAVFMRLLPGDAGYLPVYAADANGVMIEAINLDPVNSALITYLYAARD